MSADGRADFDDDLILPFQVGESLGSAAIRGRVIRLGGAIDEILRRHPFGDPVNELLGEAASLVALMGSSLKFDGRLIFQAHGDGPLAMLVADYSADGALRTTASAARDPGAARGLGALLGRGHIAVTVDQGPDMERYQGVTPIEGDTLERAAVNYFEQSEQIPTAVRLAVGRVTRPGARARWRAGGVMVQFVPGEGGARERGEATLSAAADTEAWERAAAFLQTTQDDELLDPGVAPETLLYRLFHEDGVRVFPASAVRAACSCNIGKIATVLGSYGPEDLAAMIEDGAIRVRCDFCRTEYRFDERGVPLDA